MKGLDFSTTSPFADEDDDDEASEGSSGGGEELDDESEEGEMPIDTPKKLKEVKEKVPEVIASKKEDKKVVLPPASLATSANAIGPSPAAGSGSLVKGKNGILVSAEPSLSSASPAHTIVSLPRSSLLFLNGTTTLSPPSYPSHFLPSPQHSSSPLPRDRPPSSPPFPPLPLPTSRRRPTPTSWPKSLSPELRPINSPR